MTSTFIANLMYAEIVQKRDMETKHIMVAIENKYKYKISYAKAWRAKQKALERRFGTFEAAYDNLPRMLEVLRDRNPGTYTAVKDRPSTTPPGFMVLHRAFLAFGACTEAFTHMLPVISVDGTFMTGKYKGHILTAIGVDGNNQILPLAIAFVESENYDSWLWFLRHVRVGVVRDRPGVCVIHDRHAGILKAVRTLQEDPEEPFPWRDMRSRWCIRHMGANLFKHFRKQALVKLFKRLAKQNQQRKFDTMWAMLEEHTRKLVDERNKGPAVAACDQPEGPSPLPESEVAASRSGTNMKCFSQWIAAAPLEKWSLLHDTDGARYGIMTTNLAEVYNWVLRGLRSQPLVAIVEGVLHCTIRYFRERHAKAALHAANPHTQYCSRLTTYMTEKIEKGQLHTVYVMGNTEHRFDVLLRDRAGFGTARSLITQEVCLGDHVNQPSCTCNKPKLLHKPCSHVLAACGVVKMDASNFMSEYFFKERVLQAWSGELRGFRNVGNFATLDVANMIWIPDMGMLKGGKGRRKSRRITNDMDEAQARSSGRRCGLCGQEGHTRRRCKAPAQE